jgi:hypothetical protein
LVVVLRPRQHQVLNVYAHILEEEHTALLRRWRKERAAREMQWSVQEPLQNATANEPKAETAD